MESTASVVSGKIHPNRRILMSFDDNESEWNQVDAASEKKDQNPSLLSDSTSAETPGEFGEDDVLEQLKRI